MKKITEEENLVIMKKCPRFEKCSVNKCPLDYFINQRVELQGEPKCSLGKSRRKRIGKGTNLPYQGMTKREWSGEKRWRELPEEKKRIMIERGRKYLKPFQKGQN